MSSSLWIALPIALVLAVPVDAQVALYPGHPDLAEVSVDDEILVARLDGHDVSTITQTTDRTDGVVTQESVTSFYDGSLRHRTVRFEWPSLRPLSSRNETPGAWTGETAFDGTRVSGQLVRADRDPSPFELTLPQVPFQQGVTDLVARALPLREGYVAAASTFSALSRTRDYTWTVVGPEEVQLDDGTVVSAWAVDASYAGRNSQTRRLYVDPETRALVAIQTRLSDDNVVLIEPTTRAALEAEAADREAAAPLRPGSDGLALDALQSGSRTYTLQIVAPESMRQTVGTTTLTWTLDADEAELVAETTSRGQPSTETATLAYPSLRPLSETSRTRGELTERRYADGRVRETTGSDAAERSFEAPVFGASTSLLIEVARLLPLSEGHRVSYRRDSAEGSRAVTLTVDGPGEVDGRPVWTVSADPGSGLVEVAFDPETRETVRIVLWPQIGMVAHLTPVE